MRVTATALLVVLSVAAVTADPVQDALTAFYKATNGDDWTVNTGWLSSSDYCSWYGVSCSSAGVVSTLSLRNNNLSGPLVAEIAALNQSLTVLDLGANGLSGPLPASINTFPVLKEMHLDQNSLSGPMFASASPLFALQLLNVTSNSLTGQLPPDFRPSIKYVYASHNKLTGNVPAKFYALESIRVLDLSYNDLSGAIPNVLYTRLSGLQLCRLDHNEIGCPVPTYVASHCSLAAC